MKATQLSVLVGLLLAVVVPVALSVTCYECYGEDVSYDPSDKGDLKCVHDPEKTGTKECPGDFCAKMHWEGTAEGTTNGEDWKVDVKGAARGCDTEEECTDGAELTYNNAAIGYPGIQTYITCSRGDLSNNGRVLAPITFLTVVLAALAWLAN